MGDSPGAKWDVKVSRKYPKSAKLCDYVVVTEFDIDTGSTVRHQYPEKISDVTEDWLAEHMLPEGAHNRNYDLTFIFLNQDKRRLEEEWLINPSLAPKIFDGDDNITDVFRYGLNLVNTKHDASVRRGAIVKAMAVFSSYQFVDSLEQPLHAALERYFNTPNILVLEDLYNALNSYDLSVVPNPSILERGLMRWGTASNPRESSSIPYTPCKWQHKLFMGPTAVKVSDETSDGDAVHQQIAITFPLYRDLDNFGDVSLSSLVRMFGDATMRIFNAILTKQRIVFVGYNHAARDVCRMVLSSAASVSPLPNILRRTFPYANLTDLSFLEVPGYIAGVTNPMFLQRDQWWDIACVMDLPNNTGTVYSPEEKRKTDEHSKGSGIVSVTSSSAPASTRGSNLLGGLANVGGRLLPFENPEIVQQHAQDAADSRFITGLQSVLTAKLFRGSWVGEEWVARKFFDYTWSIIGACKDSFENALLGDSSNERMKKNQTENVTPRMLYLRNNPEYHLIPSSPWVWTVPSVSSIVDPGSDSVKNTVHTSDVTLSLSVPIVPVISSLTDPAILKITDSGINASGPLLMSNIFRLLGNIPISDSEALSLFSDVLDTLDCEESVQALLTLLPLSVGGLDPIGMGLLHPNPYVRLYTVKIIRKVKEYQSTRLTVQCMTSSLQSAFARQSRLLDSGALESQITAYELRGLPVRARSETVSAGPQGKSPVTASSSSSSSSPRHHTSKPVPTVSTSVSEFFGLSTPVSVSGAEPGSTDTSDIVNPLILSDASQSPFLSFAVSASELITGILSTSSDDLKEKEKEKKHDGEGKEEEEEEDVPSISVLHY